jgi:hypothetical protein
MIVYENVKLFVPLMWMLHAFTRSAFENVRLFMRMLNEFTICASAFEDGRLFMWMFHELFDVPVRMWDCLCKCYMSLLDVPLRLFMWMLHAFTRGAFEDLWLFT